MRRRVVGLDVGSDTTRFVEGRLHKGAFEIHAAAAVPNARLAEALAERGLAGARAAVGVTGRDTILRTNQVPHVPLWQLRELMAYEVADLAEQSGDELRAGFELLRGAAAFTDEELLLLALVRRSHVDERTAALRDAGLKVSGFTPNAVALHNAVVATGHGGGTVLAAALRGRNTDVALVHDGELLFARNLSGGGDTLTDAVAEAFGIDRERAEQAKRRLGRLDAAGDEGEGQGPQVARALAAGLRQVVGMLQSTLALCRAQVAAPNLQVDRVLLCGPGAVVPGFDEALARALGVPVRRFDPTDGYVVKDLPELFERGGDFAVATGLAMGALLPGSTTVEIVSEAEERARTFRRHTAWLALAGALVVGHLALFALTSRTDHARALADVAALSRALEGRKSATADHRRNLEQAEDAALRLERLADVAAPGSGVLAVLDLLDAHLPGELWITGVRTVTAVEPDFGHAGRARPFVVVEGSGKEQDRSLPDAVVAFTSRLREHPAVAAVVPRIDPSARGGFAFELRIDPLVVPAGDGDAEDEAVAPLAGAGG